MPEWLVEFMLIPLMTSITDCRLARTGKTSIVEISRRDVFLEDTNPSKIQEPS